MSARGRHGRRGEAGFSLIELLIAVTVTIIGLTGLLSLHTTTMQGTQSSAQFAEASAFGREAMEDLRAQSVDQLETRFGLLPVNDFPLDTVAGRGGQTYNRIMSLEPLAVAPDLIRMRIDVTWTESGAVPGAEDGRYDHAIRLELVRPRAEVF